MRESTRLHAVTPHHQPLSPAKPLQDSLDAKLRRWFLPHKEARLMSEEATRTGGVWLPYPVMGFMITIAVILVGGLVALYSQLAAMNTSMLLRDATYQRERTDDRRRIEMLEVYVQNDREKLVRLEEQQKKKNN